MERRRTKKKHPLGKLGGPLQSQKDGRCGVEAGKDNEQGVACRTLLARAL